MHRFSSYVFRDLDAGEVSSGEIHAKVFEWAEGTGGLVLGVESMGLKTYFAAPIQRERIRQNEAGKVNRLSLALGDLEFKNSQLFVGNINLVRGAKVIIRRTLRALDAVRPESYRIIFRGYVTGISAKAGNITLEVSERFYDFSRPLNKREYSKVCNFVFKGPKCGYTGPETFCDKTLTQCETYGNAANFGGFPELPDLQFRRF